MSSPLGELDALLQSLLALKPPGVSPTKINAISGICIPNIQLEAEIVAKLVTHFKNSPSTHKLGVVYVVDAILRPWIEKAREANQPLTGSIPAAGTYAAGVHRMWEALPNLMNELLQDYPETQKERINKLIAIWERGNVLSPQVLASFKQKLDGTVQVMRSVNQAGVLSSQTTGFSQQDQSKQQFIPTASTSVMPPTSNSLTSAAWSSFVTTGNQTAAASTANTNQPQHPLLNLATGQPAEWLNVAPASQAPPGEAFSLTASTPVSGTISMLQQNMLHGAPAPPISGPLPAIGPTPLGATTDPNALALQMQLVQALIQSQASPEQINQVLVSLGFPQLPAPPPPVTGPSQAVNVPPVAAPPPVAVQNGAGNGVNGNHPSETNGQNGLRDHSNERRRRRSRSPDHKRRRYSPPNRRESPTYGVYDPAAAHNENSRVQERERRGRGRPNKAHRNANPLPAQHNRPISPANAPVGVRPKWIDHDDTIPEGHIKVLSRTLFLGGASATEAELRSIFSKFGKVQTCTPNFDKRHAFVKMVDRQGALAAKAGMDAMKDPEVLSKVRQTRWGVGFGPRNCCDYSTGISIIPISVLTDADRRWMLTAEYGGTGGKPIETGIVVEEPDIEIGAGVSSKAISRRMGGEPGLPRRNAGNQGPRNGPEQNASRFRKQELKEPRMVSPRPAPNTVGVPPPVPGFGFQLPGIPTNFG